MAGQPNNSPVEPQAPDKIRHVCFCDAQFAATPPYHQHLLQCPIMKAFMGMIAARLVASRPDAGPAEQALAQHPFCCDVCGARFDRLSALGQHHRHHHSTAPAPAPAFSCCVCGLRFATEPDCSRHEMQHLRCRDCGRLVCDYALFLAHSESHGPPLSCIVCRQFYPSRRELVAHQRYHLVSPPRVCACCRHFIHCIADLVTHSPSSHAGQQRGAATASDAAASVVAANGEQRSPVPQPPATTAASAVGPQQQQQRQHLQPVNAKQQPSVSQPTPPSCTALVSLLTEEQTTTPAVFACGPQQRQQHHPCRFVCSVCGCKFARPEALRLHRRIHFRCQSCGRHFSDRIQLNRHACDSPKQAQQPTTVIGAAEAPAEPPVVDLTTEANAAEGLAVVSADRLEQPVGAMNRNNNLPQHFPVPTTTVDVGDEAPAETLGLTTIARSDAEPSGHVHVDQQEPAVERPANSQAVVLLRKCSLCDATFTAARDLIAHLTEHQRCKYQCGRCGAPFHAWAEFCRHWRSHFTCAACGTQCSSSSKLRAHQRVHRELSQCRVCRKRFRSRRRLHWHCRRLHPLRCDVCWARFQSWSDCCRHRRRVHSVSSVAAPPSPQPQQQQLRLGASAPLSCSVCDKNCLSADLLERHVLARHTRPMRLTLSFRRRVFFATWPSAGGGAMPRFKIAT